MYTYGLCFHPVDKHHFHCLLCLLFCSLSELQFKMNLHLPEHGLTLTAAVRDNKAGVC